MTRTVGVEEELLLVDPSSGERRNVSSRVLHEAESEDADVDPELLRHMIETRTKPAEDLSDTERELRAGRRAAVEAADRAEAAVAAVGMAPLAGPGHQVTPDSRYARIVEQFGRLGLAAGSMAMHVHVAVDGDDEGVRIIDRLRPWLPVLVALAANSPYADGADTGYASWRQLVWTRWPSAGPSEPFGSAANYHRVAEAMLGTGAALDRGMLYFDARLSVANPTVEIRVTDVCTEVEDAVLVTALSRALVETVADEDPAPAWRSDLLRAAHWRAARHGLADDLVHPLTGERAPAAEVVDVMVDAVRPALVAAGDDELVSTALRRLAARGGGATRQRRAYEETGEIAGVVADLVARTRESAEEPQ